MPEVQKPVADLTLSVRAARTLSNPTRTIPQMLAVSPRWLLHLLPWPVLGAAAVGGLALLYRFGPARRPAEWPWLRIGALAATVLWLVGSAAFAFYVANFGSYNETYGSVGALVVLLMWFYLSAYVVIVGAELNSEIEHQTKRDTTVGHERPMGEREAYVADTVGRVP